MTCVILPTYHGLELNILKHLVLNDIPSMDPLKAGALDILENTSYPSVFKAFARSSALQQVRVQLHKRSIKSV